MTITLHNKQYPVIKQEITINKGDVIVDYFIAGFREPVIISQLMFWNTMKKITTIKHLYNHYTRCEKAQVKFNN